MRTGLPFFTHTDFGGSNMNVALDYHKRMDVIRREMERAGIDVLLGTRMVSITFVSGAFVPWRSVAVVTRNGYQGLITFLIDHGRIQNESWLENTIAYAPVPGMDMLDIAVHQIKEMGLEKSRIGVELGHSPRGNTGYLFATEMDLLKTQLPEAEFVNAVQVIDQATYVKEPGEIQLMRQAAAMADAAIASVRDNAAVGMSETEIAGIGEYELRRRGSEYHWAFTGSSEVSSGQRSAYPMTGTTPPSEKLVQRGDTLIVDFHPMYRTYMSDLSHNFFMGPPTSDQQKLGDAYTAAAETIVENLKAGNRIMDVWQTVYDRLDKSGFLPYAVPFFGHGLGVFGHEWYPAIGNSDEFKDIILEQNSIIVAFLSVTVPGVGGMRLECPVLVTENGGETLASTPLRPTVLEV
jgi:Xaa-Pro dipeptidase